MTLGRRGMVTAPVPGRAHQGQGRGPVDQVLQHLLAGDRQSSSLGGRSVSVSVRVAEDGGQEAGAQSREIWKNESHIFYRRNDQTYESRETFGPKPEVCKVCSITMMIML